MEGQIMPMVAAKLQSALEKTIYNALEKEFSKEGEKNEHAKKAWKRQAKAISEIAKDIVDFLMNDAQVAPGISVVVNPGITTTPAAMGAPSVTVTPGSGQTAAPGKLM
jgi:predicted nucleotide-binding protein (sugar kinase/HSP70/actin superfamily)